MSLLPLQHFSFGTVFKFIARLLVALSITGSAALAAPTHNTISAPAPLDDLGLLPAPFFDRHDVAPLVLPVMLGATPQHATLRVVGMMASWFGSLAGYRTAQFPLVRGQIPTRAALVLATPDDMPAGLNLGG